MLKRFCDKCGKEVSIEGRDFILRTEFKKNIEVCLSCDIELKKLVQDFMNNVQTKRFFGWKKQEIQTETNKKTLKL
jgi:hypothetical protein